MSDRPDADLPRDDGVALFLQACRERPADMVVAIESLYKHRTLPLEARWAVATLELRHPHGCELHGLLNGTGVS